MNDSIPLGSHLYRPTGEIFQAFKVPPHLAQPGSPLDNNGKRIPGSPLQNHFAKNPFRTWTGNETDFREAFTRI